MIQQTVTCNSIIFARDSLSHDYSNLVMIMSTNFVNGWTQTNILYGDPLFMPYYDIGILGSFGTVIYLFNKVLSIIHPCMHPDFAASLQCLFRCYV